MRLAELVGGGLIRSLGGWSEVKKIWFKGQDLTGPEELELLAFFGLSTNYLSKGPFKADKSVGWTLRGEPVIIPDISRSDRL